MAVEFDSLIEAAVSTRHVDPKVVLVHMIAVFGLTAEPPCLQPVGAKVPLTDVPLGRPLPPMLVTEETRAGKIARQVKTRGPLASESPTASPHEPRLSCAVLPVMSVTDQKETPGKKRVRERPPPAYWRPSPDLRGKCMGYGMGYPSSWAPDRPYVRDAMKRGVESPRHVMLCKTTPSQS